jgi:protein TonB
MLGVRIIDNAPTLPEDRASPLPPEAAEPPLPAGQGASTAAAGPDIALPVPAETPPAGEKANAGKAKARGEPSPAASKKANGYRVKVRAHLAAHRPAGGGGSGSAAVAFELSPKGHVLSARIARSSGDAAMDKSVVQSVYRSQPFPKPPAGLEAKQLRFVIAFEFR